MNRALREVLFVTYRYNPSLANQILDLDLMGSATSEVPCVGLLHTLREIWNALRRYHFALASEIQNAPRL